MRTLREKSTERTPLGSRQVPVIEVGMPDVLADAVPDNTARGLDRTRRPTPRKPGKDDAIKYPVRIRLVSVLFVQWRRTSS